MKKAVSPLISVMLVLVFTVSISTVTLNWVTDYTKTTTQAATQTATGPKGITYCANSNVEISNVAIRNVQVTSNTSVSSGDTNYFDLNSVSGTPTITFTGVSSGGLSSGLAGLWHFDDDALDSTSNNNDGVVIGAAWNLSGKISSALQFDGDDFITVADDASLDMTDAVTLEAWVNVNIEPTAWHLDGWSKRQIIFINPTAEVLTDYQIKKTIAYDSDMQADFDDLRFITMNGTNITYWIESKNSTSADVWLKVPETSTSESTNVWMYYGNPSVNNMDNVTNVLDFYSDGTDDTIFDLATGRSVVDGKIRFTSSGLAQANRYYTLLNVDFIPPFIYEFDMSHYNVAPSWGHNYMYFKGTNYTLTFAVSHGSTDTNKVYDTYSDIYTPYFSTWTDTTEYNYKIIFDVDDTITIYQDDILKYSGTNTNRNLSSDIFYFQTLIGAWSGGVGYQFLDNLKLRKYTATEPTWAADGAEQTRSISDWHANGWKYRQLITVNKSQVSGINANMPIGLSINISGANTGASDLRVFNTDGQQLAREIEMYENDKLMAWINVPNLTNTTDYQYYIYWGNDAVSEPAADSTYGSQAVWDSNYVGVWHMNNDPATSDLLDSTLNGNDGLMNGAMTSSDLVDMDYGKGIDFDGVNDYFTLPTGDSDFQFSDFSIIGTFKTPTLTDTRMLSTRVLYGTNANGMWMLRLHTDNKLYGYLYDTDWRSAVSTNIQLINKLNIFSLNKNGLSFSVFLNDVESASNTVSSWNTRNDAFEIGHFNGQSSYYWIEEIGDFRVSNISRSSNYITTIHKNINNPTATGTAPFYKTFGAVETKSIVSKSGAYGISANSTHAFATINDQTIIAVISAGWNHIALTYNSTIGGIEEMKLYIDSVELATADYSTAITTNTNDVIIGNNFNGTIDEVRIWNRELTQSEIASYYLVSNPTSSVQTTNPKASINGNNNITHTGTLTNGATTTINIDSNNFTIGQNNITIYTDAGVVDYEISMNGLSAIISNTGMNNVTIKSVVAFKTDGSNCILQNNETTFDVGEVFSISGCPMACNEFLSIKAYTDCTGVQGSFIRTPTGC